MVEFDNTKNYMYMEDNGDGTMTHTLNIIPLGVNKSAVVEMNFLTWIADMFGMVVNNPELDEATRKFVEKATLIPDSPEE